MPTADRGATRPTIWSRARELAGRTPEARNRYVDLLRAVSIMAVVTGHWLIAAPSVEDNELKLGHMLSISPWTQWLTWVFQVMPVFFIVGGYSNAASLEAAQRSGQTPGVWLTNRLRRLMGPVIPLLVVWSVIAAAAYGMGVDPKLVKFGSQAALIPLWFLAVYGMIVVLAPVAFRAWRAFGLASILALALAAVVVDIIAFIGGFRAVGWINYGFVWLTVHQLGFAWRDGRLAGPRQALPWAVGGLLLLIGLVGVGDYPLSMVGVPGEEVSNTQPPNLALLGLAALQGGVVLSLEGPARRFLRKAVPWTATVLINGTIMTVYLWHLTAMIIVVGLANALGGIGLRLRPGSPAWWGSRPIWMAVLAGVLFVFLGLFGRFERVAGTKTASSLPLWRAIPGTVLVCGGLALLALDGIGGEGPLGLRLWVLAPTFLGAALVGEFPIRGRSEAQRVE